jgi:preprotein translocase subunit SecD
MGATLTLPGIAGIVLTMGMAVDANVLIYERIREEQRNGRSILASIDTGFRRAMATIIDANMTHLIASLILFELGSGPVKGFAVTLAFGIITSFFTAVMVTRLIVVGWLNAAKPRKLTI